MAVAIPLVMGLAGQAAATSLAWSIAASAAISTTTFSAIVSAGFMVGSAIGSAMIAPDMPAQEGPRATDNKVQNSTLGAFINVPYGRTRLAGNIIWDHGICEVKTTEEVGGKGGGGAEVTTYTYFDSWAVGLCEGKVSTIHKIWFDSDLVYDGATAETNEAIKDKFETYYGDEYQEPDPLIESIVGLYKTPAYRGLCYIVFDNILLEDWGNRIPNITVELTRSPDASVSSEIYPIESVDGFNSFSTVTSLKQFQSFYSDYLNFTTELVSGTMYPAVAYKSYTISPEYMDFYVELVSGTMYPVVDYISYDIPTESLNYEVNLLSGTMYPVVDYISYDNWPEEMLNFNVTLISGSLSP